MNRPLPSPHNVQGPGENPIPEKSLSIVTLTQTSPWRPRVMLVTSEEQRDLFSYNLHRSSAIMKKTEKLNNFLLFHINMTNCTRLLSNERQAHTFQDEPRFSTKNSSKTAKTICFHDVSCSFLFDRNVHRDVTPFFCARTAHDRDAALDWRTTLSDSAAGRRTCSESKSIAKALGARYRCGSLLDKVA